jgi:hypothetical protein
LLACLRLWHCQVNERDAQHLNLRLKRSITSCSNTIFTPKNDPRRWYDPDSEEGAYRVNVARSQHQHNSQPVRSAYQPPASSTFLSERTSHQQPAATSQQYSSLRTNQHQPSATSQPNRLSTLLLSRVLKHLEISDLFSYSFLDAVSTWLLITPSSSFICHL